MAITLPTAEYHARAMANGLTRYGYAEIVAAAHTVEGAVGQYVAEVTNAAQMLEPHREGVLRVIYDEQYQALEHLLDSSLIHDDWAGTSTELWPVGKWLRNAATYRSVARRIRKALRQLAVSA